LTGLIAAVTAACLAILLVDGSSRPDTTVPRLQRAVGGLGLGAVAVPAWSFSAFDPRLDPTCDAEEFPLPGVPCFTPDHIGPLSHFETPHGLDGILRMRAIGPGPGSLR
jgi:hypothetical protein